MLNCLIVDDEQNAVDILSTFVEQTPFLTLFKGTTNPIEAVGLIQSEKIDLVFLDIHMPQLSGLDLAKIIKGKVKIIFTTAYSDHAVDAFDLEAIDYLTKPIPFDRFLKAAQKAVNTNTGNPAPEVKANEIRENDFILVKTENKGKFIKINIYDIVFVEGLKNYISIYTVENEKIVTLMTLKDMEETLPTKDFVRVHKSYIIAMDSVKVIDGNQIFLKELKAAIPLGESYRAPFFENLEKKVKGGRRQ